ncbi:putative ABC transporter permease YknZ [Clostridium acetireducens DSM 10703]|uniref:Putative ABC transporter permease YknZ n=1 Tax=Clostridium acetireducens DSM 10703 TaxID=1121290 RepID=A0A1E8EYT2_9CLOT|nr:ABC transporter permease [Clostridium acetireducens]OFI05852.1 putative ABC transporter permease YknZ [Clostridium acetireducens DSM 10703]
MKNLKGVLEMAFSSIIDNKLRYILTLIGIVLGISSLIAIVSLGNGVGDDIKESIMSSDGTRSISLTFNPSENFSPMDNTNAFNDSVIGIIKNVPGVKSVEQEFSAITEMKIKDKSVVISVNCTQKSNNISMSKIIDGRSFNNHEFNKVSRVCIINKTLKDKLFQNEKAIGKVVQVADKPMTVIGVMQEQGATSFMDFDSIYIPRPTWSITYGDDSARSLKIAVKEDYDMKEVSKKVVDKLNKTSNLDGRYEVVDMEKIAKSVGKVSSILTGFIASIASISLVVAGIGIMNIMYMAIIERTREIGIRRALGATSKNILFQFLIESIVICLIGGIVGVLLGIGLANGIAAIIKIHAKTSFGIVALGLGTAIFMGVVFGISPALKAAKLNPIDALSYE